MSNVAADGITPEPLPVVMRAGRSFVAHAKLIGLLTLASRVLGLAREVVAGHYLGTGLVASAFTVAFVIPNLFRKLFGEGALSAAFIPLYAKSIKEDGTAGANEFAARGVNLLVAILIAITIVGEAILAALILFSGARADQILTLKLAAVMLPYVILICGTAFLGGVLQVHRRFAAPAAAPVILNICHIAVVFIGARVLRLRGDAPETDQLIATQTTLAYWLGFFVLVAGVLQLAILLPELRAVGFQFRATLHVWTPAVRTMLRLTVPVALGAGVLQLSVLLDKAISVLLMQGVDAAGNAITHFTLFGQSIRYPMELGAPARLNLAQFLYQFPLGVFAIALATAIFPSLSAEALGDDRQKFRAVLRQGIEATMLEGLPASIGLILVSEPAVRLLFQHGQISAHDAELISRSVVFYAAGIWAFSLQQIINRAYYALHDTKTPLVMSALTLLVNVMVEIPLLWTPLAEAGMAAGTCISFSIQSLVMLYMLDSRVGGIGLATSAKPILKMALAAALMGLTLWLLRQTPLYPKGDSRIVWAGQLMLLMIVGAAVYFTACKLMGVAALDHLLPRRFRSRSRAH